MNVLDLEDMLKIFSNDGKLTGIPSMLYEEVELSKLKSTEKVKGN